MRWLCVALVSVVLCSLPARAHADEQRAWVKEIKDDKTWKRYSKPF
jgi:hypothetical protein